MTGVLPRLHVCGFSARAAVQAAIRCGFECEGWDCFGDRDATRLAAWNRIGGLRREDLQELLTRPPGIVLPCGGLENCGSLWASLSERHRVIGPDVGQLRMLRSPRWLSGFCNRRESPMRFPPSCFDHRDFVDWIQSTRREEMGGGCLVKRRKSGGGVGLRLLKADDRSPQASVSIQHGEYLQRYVAGDEYSVVLRCGLEPKVLFASRPWPEIQDSHPRFIYRGSMGPATLPPPATAACLAFASEIGAAIGYSGVLQIDLIVAAVDAQVYLFEVNPRWSGSMEVAELLSPGSIIGEMMPGTDRLRNAAGDDRGIDTGIAAAKAILYAETDVVIDQELSDVMFAASLPGEEFTVDRCVRGKVDIWLADVPPVGTAAVANSPICTLLGVGPAGRLSNEIDRGMARWRAEVGGAKMRSASEAM